MSRENIDIKALKQRLLDTKDELERLSRISVESRAPVELDQTTQGRLSRQDALLQQEMAKETERRRQKDLERIKAALQRMENDDYGYCISCDEEISYACLKLDPALTTCIDCAK
mgnify:CR=1 FL=1